MKISKAIEILQLDHDDPGSCNIQDVQAAEALLIEAGKFTKNLRDTAYISKLHLLPGEDPE